MGLMIALIAISSLSLLIGAVWLINFIRQRILMNKMVKDIEDMFKLNSKDKVNENSIIEQIQNFVDKQNINEKEKKELKDKIQDRIINNEKIEKFKDNFSQKENIDVSIINDQQQKDLTHYNIKFQKNNTQNSFSFDNQIEGFKSIIFIPNETKYDIDITSDKTNENFKIKSNNNFILFKKNPPEKNNLFSFMQLPKAPELLYIEFPCGSELSMNKDKQTVQTQQPNTQMVFVFNDGKEVYDLEPGKEIDLKEIIQKLQSKKDAEFQQKMEQMRRKQEEEERKKEEEQKNNHNNSEDEKEQEEDVYEKNEKPIEKKVENSLDNSQKKGSDEPQL